MGRICLEEESGLQLIDSPSPPQYAGRRLPPLHNHPWSIAAMRRAVRQSASPVKPSVAVADRDQAIQEQTKESVRPSVTKEKESTPADQGREDETDAAVKTSVVQKHKESVDSVAASQETAPSLASVEPSVTKEKESTPQNQARGHETAPAVKPSLTEEKKSALQYQAKARDRAAASVKPSLTVETARKAAIGEQKPGKLPNLEDALEFPFIPAPDRTRLRASPTLGAYLGACGKKNKYLETKGDLAPTLSMGGANNGL
ncbi:uncharacterized protein [Triticum aestivum]|uniref:uncharacterized protein isoform X2 n=1 Tax=Triticum aestivum TaxID=4565 RepID=UPI001D0147C3|nr:uncharacterized protein LOC123144316 isoform X2 [Triticum aestivum]